MSFTLTKNYGNLRFTFYAPARHPTMLKTAMKIFSIILSILLILLVAGQAAAAPPADFPDVCQSPENIMPNCDFSSGLGGWTPFLESGAASIEVQQGGGECHAPLCPAAHIVTEGNFTGGIYQQVSVTPGNSYYANIVWLAFDSYANDAAVNKATGGIGRRVGIDPTGGTDSRAGSVVWSEDNWRNDCKICNVEQVTITAQANIITVFLRIDDNWRQRAVEKGYSVPVSRDQFWLDDIGLKQVGEGAAPPPTDTPAPPTDTPAPPTNTPVPAAAAAVAATPTVEPVEVAQTEEAESPVTTPTAAATVASPPTLTPSPTRTPTATPPPRATTAPRTTRVPPPEPSLVSLGLPGTLGATACVGSIFLLVMAGVFTGAIWLYRLGWGQPKPFTPPDSPDDAEAVEASIVEDE
jgi:hypothetical protein